MANFNTHLLGGATASGGLSSLLMLSGQFTPTQGLILWSAGTLGGLLPDLDADASPTLRGLFTALGILAAFIILFHLTGHTLLELWGAMLLTFILVRFGAMTLFARLTEHRGAFHSLLATITFALGTVYLCWRGLHWPVDMAWATGLMLGWGYLVHLILDECFAVNLTGLTLKRSFGTALKPVSLKNLWASALFLIAAGLFAWQLPAPKQLDKQLYQVLQKPQLIWQKPLPYKST